MSVWLADARSVMYLDLRVREFRLKKQISPFSALDLSIVPSKPAVLVPDMMFQVFSTPTSRLSSVTVAQSTTFFQDVSAYLLEKLENNWKMDVARLYVKLLKAYSVYINEALFPVEIFGHFSYSKTDQLVFQETQMLHPARKLGNLLLKNNCMDTQLVAEFICTVCISAKLTICVFLESDIGEVSYILNHLQKAACGIEVWMRDCFRSYAVQQKIQEKPEHLKLLLNYGFIFESSMQQKCMILPPYEERGLTELQINQQKQRREALISELCNVFIHSDTPVFSSCLESLCLYWRSIPDPFVTQEEMRSVFPMLMHYDDEEYVEKICNKFKKSCIFQLKTDDILQPRSLLHLSRCAVRNILGRNSQLPDGIHCLRLPNQLQSYLRLEF